MERNSPAGRPNWAASPGPSGRSLERPPSLAGPGRVVRPDDRTHVRQRRPGRPAIAVDHGQGKTIGDSQTGWNAFDDAGAKSDVTTESFYLIVENPQGRSTRRSTGRDSRHDRASDGSDRRHRRRANPVFYADAKSQLPPVVDPFALAAVAPDQAPDVLSADGTTAIVTARVPATTTSPRSRPTRSSRWRRSSRPTIRA